MAADVPDRLLLRAYEDVRDDEAAFELSRRGILEGRPRWAAAHYAAHLVAARYGGARVDAASHDVVAQGQRLKVLARKRHGRDPIHNTVRFDPDHQDFDALVWVFFDDEYSLVEAWYLPWSALGRILRPYKDGWRLYTRGNWRSQPHVVALDLS